MNRQNYMDILSEQIRYKHALPMVTREIEAHIDDQKEEFLTEGMTEREAEEAAVREMGDPVRVGVEMDRIHRPKMNWPLMAAVGILNLLGILFLAFMKYHVPVGENGGLTILVGPVGEHIAFAIIGFLIMVGICYIDYTRIAYWAKEILIIAILFLLIGNMFFAFSANGAANYMYLPGGIYVNSRFVVMFLFPLHCAVLYNYQGQGYKGILKGSAWIMPIALVMARGYAMTQLFLYIPMLAVVLSFAVCKGYFKVAKKRTLAMIWCVTILIPAALAAAVWQFGAAYQKMRLELMVNPGKYVADEGYPFHTIRRLLDGSRMVGKNSSFSETADLIPDGGSQVLTYVIAYFGILAAVLIVGVILLLVVRLTALTLRQKNRLGMLMGMGCSLTILSHIILYILMNTGVFPPVGYVYCPFLTAGRSGMLVMYVLFGVMFSIYRYQSVSEAKRAAKTAEKIRGRMKSIRSIEKKSVES